MEGTLNQKKARALMRRHGWKQARGGKHGVKMVKGGERPMPLPRNHGADYGPGLTNGILKSLGLAEKEGGSWNSRSLYMQNGRASGLRSTSYRDASPQRER